MRVANGELLTSEGKADAVKVTIQGHSFLTDLYVLALVGCEKVLGVYWL